LSEGSAIVVSVLAATVPTLVYVLILWWLDHYEREPQRLLSAAFLWGALPAAVLSVFAEHWLSQPAAALGEAAAGWLSSTIAAPVVEELAKGLAVLLLLVLARGEFDDVLDGIIYGATVGFGFAMTENVLYFVRSFTVGGLPTLTLTILLRAFVFGMNHALFTAVFGASLGYARTLKRGPRRWLAPPLGLLAGMLLHGVHNLSTRLAGRMCFAALVGLASDWGGAGVILAVIVLAWRQERRWIAAHLRAEVESGLLSAEEYGVLSSYQRRTAAWWRALGQGGIRAARRQTRLNQLATELAFKLEQGDQKRAAKLREAIASLRQA